MVGMELKLDGTININHLTVDVYDTNASTSSCGKGGNQLFLTNSSAKPIVVNGNFSLIDGKMHGGEYHIKGNFDAQCAGGTGPTTSLVCAGGGSSVFKFNGSSSQTIQVAATAVIPGTDVYFNNSSGFVFSSEVSLNNQNIHMQSGDISLSGYNFLGIADISDYSSSIVPLSSESIVYTSCLGGAVGAPCP